ncbi:MAG: helix-turn-helix transcriptional regulator [Bryobacterales bacterium]|nr:helix-turn-helix transcriptional regulator [Bryobacterales bacterium]
MAKGEYLGDFEQLVLLALLRLGDEAYGMNVRQEIEDRTGRTAAIGAVYATLERLEKKGYVSSTVGEPTEERGGRAKKYFKIEGDGLSALRQSQEALRRMTKGLRSVLGEA